MEERFGSRLKKARNLYGFTQEDVAREMMINRVNLTRYENGVNEPDIETLAHLASFYAVTVDWLLGFGEYPKRSNLSTWDKDRHYTKGFSDRLKLARKEKGVTQETVAFFLKVPRSTLAHYETGRVEPSIRTLASLAGFYGVTTDWLLGLSEGTSQAYRAM